MTTILSSYLDEVTIGEMQVHQRMAVLPLIGPPGETFYLTLAEALGDNLLEVTEVSEGGTVPELSVENRADLPVLLLDGEELAGAKQNRVLNASVLLAPQSTTVIPVSCTEAGRWQYTSRKFSDSDVVMTPRMRSTKNRSVSMSLAADKSYRSNQSMVWDSISELQAEAKLESPTSAMRDVYESRKTKLKSYVEAFPIAANQTGLLVMIDGAVVGLDILSRSDAFARLGPKMIRSYAMETIGPAPEKASVPSVATGKAFMASLEGIVPKPYDSPGVGQDYRFTSNVTVGSALVYREAVIHAAFFAIEPQSTKDETSMRRAAQRRRFRM